MKSWTQIMFKKNNVKKSEKKNEKDKIIISRLFCVVIITTAKLNNNITARHPHHPVLPGQSPGNIPGAVSN